MKSPRKTLNKNGIDILVVEDSPTQAEQLKSLLVASGYTVTVAANAKQALAEAHKRKPTLIISDIVMPGMDGYTLCKTIKSDEKLKDIPVILVTSLSLPQDVLKGLECGADHFIRKPYDEKYLLSRIQYLLANWEMRRGEKLRLGVEIYFAGQRHFVTAARQQILDLLISTYEEAVRINAELSAREAELIQLSEQLERNVEERTAALIAEIAQRKRAEEEIRRLNEDLERRVAERTAELAAANKQLELRNSEVERAGKFKDQFLSTMSHELRTPLNAVLGFSELLADERYGTFNERQGRYISHIHTSGKHLLSLINDILDLSKIEAGRLELAVESVRVETAFGEVLGALRPLAEKKSQTLSQHMETGLYVRADATRFKQVLMNLLGNAIKFTPEGGHIELAARLMEGQVRVDVRDTGPGIPPEEQKRIFEAFYRLRQSGKTTEGTGLGLAITRRLVELHGGQLGLESQPSQGSCFYFSLPVAPAVSGSLARETASRARAGEPLRILVIEDDPAAGQLIQSQLTSSGYAAVVCDQPQHSAEIAAELQPDAITLDLLMKKPANGWEVLSQLKRDPRTASTPVIVVTVLDQRALGALLGADEYVVKPVDKVALLAAVERCLTTRGGASPARPILVVEDDAPTSEVITELLTAQGYAVATAADGAQARAQVAASLPELVILDLLLPKVSGFQLLAEWRASPRTADLPVFVLTSKDLSREEESYLRTHTESLFRKQQPWQEALVKQLHRVLNLGQLERA